MSNSSNTPSTPMMVTRKGERIDFDSSLTIFEAASACEKMTWSSFATDLARKHFTAQPLSGVQLMWIHYLAIEQIARDAAPKAATVEAPTGRQEIEGEIVNVKVGYGQFGETIRMTVKVETPEGEWKCNGTVPASIRCADLNSLKGCMVRFTATLSASDRPEFVFAKRPSKATLVTAPETSEELSSRYAAIVRSCHTDGKDAYDVAKAALIEEIGADRVGELAEAYDEEYENQCELAEYRAEALHG